MHVSHYLYIFFTDSGNTGRLVQLTSETDDGDDDFDLDALEIHTQMSDTSSDGGGGNDQPRNSIL